MKQYLFLFLTLGCLFILSGCQVNPQPAQPQVNRTVIIEKPARPQPPVIVAPQPVVPQQPPIIVVPPRRPGISIEINGGNSCNVHKHCGHCDLCRRNGWISINIGK